MGTGSSVVCIFRHRKAQWLPDSLSEELSCKFVVVRIYIRLFPDTTARLYMPDLKICLRILPDYWHTVLYILLHWLLQTSFRHFQRWRFVFRIVATVYSPVFGPKSEINGQAENSWRKRWCRGVFYLVPAGLGWGNRKNHTRHKYDFLTGGIGRCVWFHIRLVEYVAAGTRHSFGHKRPQWLKSLIRM